MLSRGNPLSAPAAAPKLTQAPKKDASDSLKPAPPDSVGCVRLVEMGDVYPKVKLGEGGCVRVKQGTAD